MDDLNLSGKVLINALDQIANINKWLGGNRVTIDGVKKMMRNRQNGAPISIVDIGCGNGDMLREIAEFGRKNEFNFQLLGLDANQATIDYAKKLSSNFKEISFKKENVFSKEFRSREFDIGLCTLFLHHFEDDEALELIKHLTNSAKLGLVVNDLHRHRLAYYLFKLVSLTSKNPMVKSDGLTSIKRAFKRADFETFSEKLQYKSTLSWRWAFRYQWIIHKY